MVLETTNKHFYFMKDSALPDGLEPMFELEEVHTFKIDYAMLKVLKYVLLSIGHFDHAK